jgi:hypothetical protein
MGLLGVAKANTAVGVSSETFLLLLLLLLLQKMALRGHTKKALTCKQCVFCMQLRCKCLWQAKSQRVPAGRIGVRAISASATL